MGPSYVVPSWRLTQPLRDVCSNGIDYLFALSGGSFASPRFVEALHEAARPMRSKKRKGKCPKA